MKEYEKKCEQKPPGEQKKQYQSPQLVTYGDIRAITQSAGAHGALDGVLVLKTSL